MMQTLQGPASSALNPGRGAFRARSWLGLGFAGTLLCVGAGTIRAEDMAAGLGTGANRGFGYFNDRLPGGPWSVHVFKVARQALDLELHTTLARSNQFGMALVSELALLVPPEVGTPLAAINGDFYESSRAYFGRPRDLQVRLGELVTSPTDHQCFWIDPKGDVHMTNLQSRLRVVWPDGTAVPIALNAPRGSGGAVLYSAAVGASTHTRGGQELVLGPGTNSLWLPLRPGLTYSARILEVRTAGDTPVASDTLVLSLDSRLAERLNPVAAGDLLAIVLETVPDLTGVQTALGGGPSLVRDGKAREFSGLQFRHPRTAVGWNRDFVFLVVVDGRQRGLSVGMSFPELADYLVKLGCDHAINLDGGGSATLWVMGNVMNNPSERRERPAPNALVVLEKRRAPPSP